MKAFRSYLHDFNSSAPQKYGPTYSRGMDINEMMKAKFARSRRQSFFAWVAFMVGLLLVYLYVEHYKWDDTLFHLPTKYNITALLEDGITDNAGSGPNMPAIHADDTAIKNGKTSKKDSEPNAVPGGDENPSLAKAAKVSKGDEKEVNNAKTKADKIGDE